MAARDLPEAARLAGQLGYPTTEDEIAARFAGLAGSTEDYVCVAETEGSRIAGWMHLHVYRTLEGDAQVEILGLVVDSESRRQGVGRALMAEAERWARARGVAAIRLRSNIVRAGAHAFYQALGFRIIKTQHAFEKRLPTGSESSSDSTPNRLRTDSEPTRN